jgi:hypothetical protein
LRAAGFFAALFFLAAVFLRAAGFFAALFFLAAVFLRAAGFFAAVFLRAAGFFAAVFLRAAGLRAADFFFAAVFLAAAMLPPPFPWFPLRVLDQEAMRFKRRRSLSLIPPQTPYRSSRRKA